MRLGSSVGPSLARARRPCRVRRMLVAGQRAAPGLASRAGQVRPIVQGMGRRPGGCEKGFSHQHTKGFPHRGAVPTCGTTDVRRSAGGCTAGRARHGKPSRSGPLTRRLRSCRAWGAGPVGARRDSRTSTRRDSRTSTRRDSRIRMGSGGCEKGFSHQDAKGFSHQDAKGFSRQHADQTCGTTDVRRGAVPRRANTDNHPGLFILHAFSLDFAPPPCGILALSDDSSCPLKKGTGSVPAELPR